MNLNPKTNYTDFINSEVEYYYNVYHFDMNYKGKHRSYNNEADAFKHTFMQAHMNLYTGNKFSKLIGDNHESNPNNDPNEKNMDLWNNRQGREIAREIKEQYPNWILLPKREQNDIIARKVMIRMRKGQLITNPNDKKHKYVDTGYAAPIEWSNLGDLLGQAIKNDDKKLNDLIKYYSRLFNNPSSVMSAQAYENEKLFNDVVNRYYPNLKYSTGLENGHWITINGNHVFIKDKK